MKEPESETVKCNLFNCNLTDLEKAVPSFINDQGLRGLALQFRDRPWYLLLVIEYSIRNYQVKWDTLDLSTKEEIDTLIETTCPYWFSDPQTDSTYKRLRDYKDLKKLKDFWQ